MIKLIQQDKYFSLDKIENYLLKDFSVITGINGSGKTQLLTAIDQGVFKIDGISQAEIIYYNYNDFNLVYEKTSENEVLKYKHDRFKNKSEEFFKRLHHERNSILNSYNVLNNSSLASNDFFIKEEIVLESLDLTDKEIEAFENYRKTNSHLNPTSLALHFPILVKHKALLEAYLLQIPNINIRTWLMELKGAFIKHNILISLKNINWDFILNPDWEDSEIDKYNSMAESFLPTIVGYYYSLGFKESFVNFVISVDSNHNLSQFKKQVGLIKLKEYLLELSNDIKMHFKKNISKEYIDIAIKLNGEENMHDIIQVGDGFLNLQEIASEEKHYQLSKLQNNYNQLISIQDPSIKYYNETEFIKIHGLSPIDMLNAVLNEYDCNGYEFKKNDIHIDLMYGIDKQEIKIILHNKSLGYTTNLEDLSSGEKTLIALSFYLYKLKQKKAITRLLLLDEIDSALHPSMCKRLLDVLYNIFHIKMGINIILSTHSPSTVALAPNESIFLMNRHSISKILNVSKDRALKELTIGVPSFSVNYENRRQVFVESEYDASYYESLYNIYNDKLNPEISLNFISSGKTKINGNGIGIASCDQVVSIVNILRKAGNNFSWGIIDWDLKNKSSEFIRVLGNSQRYSIENYLLDPLLLAILLWKENILEAEHFGFEKNEVYFNILNFDQSQLQQIVNKIISDLHVNLKNENSPEQVNYTLCNGITLQIPIWYCKTQGHLLEDIIIKTYPQLETIRKKDESALKKAIINKVILNFKGLCSIDLLNTFKSIQDD